MSSPRLRAAQREFLLARYVVIWLSEREAVVFTSQVAIWILHFCHARAPFCRRLAGCFYLVLVVYLVASDNSLSDAFV